MAYHRLCLTSRDHILNLPFCPALEVLADRFYVLGEVIIEIDERKLVLEGLHVHERDLITETLVSLEHDMFSLWGVYNPFCECFTCYAISTVIELGDVDEVFNALFVDPHIKKAEHNLACAPSNARVIVLP